MPSFTTLNQPVQNLCSPATVYGGYDQTLFLGCSVRSFSTSLGWDEQVSEITVELVRDPCPALEAKPKTYWDASLNKQTTIAVDPGFIGYDVPLSGRPVFFRMGEFEFSGILQDWTETEGTGGYPVYTVKLIDPRSILSGVHLITGDYAGSVGSQFNIFNCYGYLESLGSACPLTDINGGTFGSPAGGFGGANTTGGGMQVSSIVAAFNVLANGVPRVVNQFSPYGRVLYNGTTGGSYGSLNEDLNLFGSSFSEYFIDLSELPTTPTYYRLPGPSVTLLEFVSQICVDCGYSFYWEMIPIKNASSLAGSGIAKFLKLRTVSRLTQPAFGAIENFVSGVEGAISTSVGRETVQEQTASFIIGGPVESIYQAEQNTDVPFDGDPLCDEEDNMILPYVGLDANNDLIIPCLDDDDLWEFDLDTADINATLTHVALPATVTIKEKELLAVAGGESTWLAWEGSIYDGGNPTTDIGAELFGPGKIFPGGKINVNAIIDRAKTGKPMHPHEIANPHDGFMGVVTDIEQQNDVRLIYDWLNSYAQGFGTKYMVRVPYTCAKRDTDTNLIITSEVPQQDGWTDYASVLGLATDALAMELFRNDSGKIEAMVRYDGIANLSIADLNPGEYAVALDEEPEDEEDTSKVWIKASVEPKYVYHDSSTLFVPRAVVTISTPIRESVNNPQPYIMGLAELIRAAAEGPPADIDTAIPGVPAELNTARKLAQNLIGKAGGDELFFDFPDLSKTPDAVSFGLKSTVTTYGPWTVVGLPGQIKVETDPSLVPWEFGSTANMNLAGNALAAEGVIGMKVAESGSVQVPGYPTIPLGAELGAYAGGFFGGGSHLVENRTHSEGGGSAHFNYSGNWTGLYGPNITNISMSNGAQGATTNYEFRTYTPRRGTFAKLNADRLRNQGRMRIAALREARLKALSKVSARLDVAVGNRETRKKYAEQFKKHSSSTFLVADYGESAYPTVTLKSSTYIENDMGASGIERRSLVGLDSVFTPVSLRPQGGVGPYGTGLPNLVGNLAGWEDSFRNFTRAALPLAINETGGQSWGRAIGGRHSNPWSNPTGGFENDEVMNYQLSGKGSGHNNTYAVRDNQSGLTLSMYNEASGDKTYSNTYNVVALKGPIIIQQWGYDTDGKPVPNAADDEAACLEGTFEHEFLTDNFMPGWLQKPKTWPVAPLDVRLDRMRGVWVAPPPRSKLTVVLEACLSPYEVVTALITGYNDSDPSPIIYDSGGMIVDQPRIHVYDNVGSYYASGTRLYVDFDSTQNRYYPVQARNGFNAMGTTWVSGNNSEYQIYTTGTWTPLTYFAEGVSSGVSVNCKHITNLLAGPGIIFEEEVLDDFITDFRDRCGESGSGCGWEQSIRITAQNYVTNSGGWVGNSGMSFGGERYNGGLIFGNNISTSGFEESSPMGNVVHMTAIGAHMTYGWVTGVPTGAMDPSSDFSPTRNAVRIGSFYVDNSVFSMKIGSYDYDGAGWSDGVCTGYLGLTELHPPTGTGIEVVTSVVCNTGSGESGITVSYKTLNFDAYGRLTSVS
jgi:hypothetical protein